MENISKRPRLIRVLQIVLILSGISNGLLLVLFAFALISGNGIDQLMFSPYNLIKSSVGATLFLAAANEISRIRNRGRWLGAVSFFFFATLNSYSMFSVAFDPDPGFEFLSKNGIVAINAVQVILFAAASFYLMFSAEVIEYFNPRIDDKIMEPPPPPSFDS